MTNLAWHVVIRLTSDRVLATGGAQRRTLSRCVWDRVGSKDLLAFRLADTHVHLLTCGNRRDVGRFAHDVEVSMRWQLRLPPKFERARITPVSDSRHLRNAFDYVQRQAQRHGLDMDPLHEAGNLLDLLGLRVAGPASIANVRRLLPRIDRQHLVELFLDGLPRVPREAFANDMPLPAILLERLYVSACSAACLGDLEGRAGAAARVAAVEVAGSRVTTGQLAELLGVDARTIRRMRSAEADPRLVEAIRRQLQLRAFLPPERD